MSKIMLRPNLKTEVSAILQSPSNTLVTTVSLMARGLVTMAQLTFDDTGMVAAHIVVRPPKAAMMPLEAYIYPVSFLPERVDCAALYQWYKLAEKEFWNEYSFYAKNIMNYHMNKAMKYVNENSNFQPINLDETF